MIFAFPSDTHTADRFFDFYRDRYPVSVRGPYSSLRLADTREHSTKRTTKAMHNSHCNHCIQLYQASCQFIFVVLCAIDTITIVSSSTYTYTRAHVRIIIIIIMHDEFPFQARVLVNCQCTEIKVKCVEPFGVFHLAFCILCFRRRRALNYIRNLHRFSFTKCILLFSHLTTCIQHHRWRVSFHLFERKKTFQHCTRTTTTCTASTTTMTTTKNRTTIVISLSFCLRCDRQRGKLNEIFSENRFESQECVWISGFRAVFKHYIQCY